MSMGTEADRIAFEAAVGRALVARLRSDEAACCAMWSALANTEWSRAEGGTVCYSFRQAVEVIVAVRGADGCMDWYRCGPYATVSGEIEAAMAGEGWTHRPTAV